METDDNLTKENDQVYEESESKSQNYEDELKTDENFEDDEVYTKQDKTEVSDDAEDEADEEGDIDLTDGLIETAEDTETIDNTKKDEEDEEKVEPELRDEQHSEFEVDLELERKKQLDEEMWNAEKNPNFIPSRENFPNLPNEFNRDDFPMSYRENLIREEACLQLVDNFSRQFRLLYGDRKPLYLAPKNECDIRKFVCTTLQVAHPAQSKLLLWQGAAELVSKAIVPVPLLPCTEPPSRLLAPDTALELRKGTAFEAASLLVSLLLGVGYNAFVVQGYASREVCLVDQKRVDCPVEKDCKNDQETKSKSEIDMATNTKKDKRKKYVIRPPKDLRSKFELEQAARKVREEEERIAKIREERAEAERLAEEPRNDPLFGQRVHAWVLILAGKREVAENFFIEPFTGRAIPIDKSTTSRGYLGIEAVWNNKNYFVNMQTAMLGVDALNFDLSHTGFWEYLIPGQESVTVEPITTDANAGGIESFEEEYNQDEPITKTKEKYFELPKTWTKRLEINMKDFQKDYRQELQEITYRKAVSQYFPVYMKYDGVVEKTKRYEDRLLQNLQNTTETFANRKDKLCKRQTGPKDEWKSEYFERGRKSHLKEHHIFTDQDIKQIMKFYHKSRVDHLKEIRTSKNQMMIYYKDRADYLTQQVVTFVDSSKKVFGPAHEMEESRPYETVKEIYDRNLEIEAHKDIREISYYLKEDRVQIYFHPDKDNISGDIMKLVKNSNEDTRNSGPNNLDSILLDNDESSFFYVDPYRPKMTQVEIFQYFQGILRRERSTINTLRNIESEVKNILSLRSKESISNDLVIQLFDRVNNSEAREKRIEIEKSIEADKARVQDEELDYLEPFLLRLDVNLKEITKESAKKVYDECLNDFKERAMKKANILQHRFEEETRKMEDNQSWYQKNQMKMTPKIEEEYTQKTAEIGFRVTTLEKMLSRHKQMIEYKERDLKQKLKNDHRLIRMYT